MYARKIIAVLITVLTWAAHTCAQPIYFDELYDSGLSQSQNEGIWAESVIGYPDGYLFISFSKYNLTGITGMYLVRTDQLGDTVWTRTHIDVGFQEFFQNMAETESGGYATASTRVDLSGSNPDQEGAACITNVNSDGQIIWKQCYGSDTLREVGLKVLPLGGGGASYCRTTDIRTVLRW